MLSADLVHTRRRAGVLHTVPLGARRTLAEALARDVVEIAGEHVGRSIGELQAAWDALDVEPRNRKLKDGLAKLVLDRLEVGAESEHDPVALRRAVFRRATETRRALTDGAAFDREAVLTEIAAAEELKPDELEAALFSDLRDAHVVRRKTPHEIVPGGAPALVAGYDLAQRQAVLLRATHLRVTLRSPDPRALRALFRALKFRRLLFEVRHEDGGVVLDLDGPFSLFESVTKYGLALALALPVIEAAGDHVVDADVRWGKDRTPLRFVHEGPRTGGDAARASVPEEIATLMSRWRERRSRFLCEPADIVLDLPGVGVCVPDLLFTDARTGKHIFVEVLGFWSREAVWKRVELAERGLAEAVVFCASERLRVSEGVLERPSARLLVYKGVISPAALEEKLAVLAG